ncbi:MAG: LysE family transporter [Candidatus Gracilibacteria bacterium]|jgi:threonine/homoserine/homoserine lactone efflux protein
MLLATSAIFFGFTQGLIIGPLSLYAIREGLNPCRGIKCEAEVFTGALLVDITYSLLAMYGAASFINYGPVQTVLWTLAAYMLITMGINSFHSRQKKMSFHHLHRHKLAFYDNDFFRGLMINMVNPMAIVFWVVVGGSMYADYSSVMPPFIFALNIIAGTIPAYFVTILVTFFIRRIFHQWMLKRLIQAGSLVLTGYGLWFTWRAAVGLPELFTGVVSLF